MRLRPRFDRGPTALLGAVSVLLAHVHMRQHIHRTGSRKGRFQLEILLPGAADAALVELVGHLSGVHRPPPDPVHRPDEEVPRVSGYEFEYRIDGVREEVHLEAESDRQTAVLGSLNRLHIAVQAEIAVPVDECPGVVGEAAIRLALPPSSQGRLGLDAAVEMLGEADLVHPSQCRRLDIGLDQPIGVATGWRSAVSRLMRMEMEVVVTHRRSVCIGAHRGTNRAQASPTAELKAGARRCWRPVAAG